MSRNSNYNCKIHKSIEKCKVDCETKAGSGSWYLAPNNEQGLGGSFLRITNSGQDDRKVKEYRDREVIVEAKNGGTACNTKDSRMKWYGLNNNVFDSTLKNHLCYLNARVVDYSDNYNSHYSAHRSKVDALTECTADYNWDGIGKVNNAACCGTNGRQACFALAHKSSNNASYWYYFNKQTAGGTQLRTMNKSQPYDDGEYIWHVSERASNFPTGYTWKDCIDKKNITTGKLKFYGFY